jgi:hypothetical protein
VSTISREGHVPSAFGDTREFDPWGRRGPVEGSHRFKIAASTCLDRKIIQETRFRA